MVREEGTKTHNLRYGMEDVQYGRSRLRYDEQPEVSNEKRFRLQNGQGGRREGYSTGSYSSSTRQLRHEPIATCLL